MSAVAMDSPTYDSPVWKFVSNFNIMRLSNDVDRSDPITLSSLGVVDLDTDIVPDVFGCPTDISDIMMPECMSRLALCFRKMLSIKVAVICVILVSLVIARINEEYMYAFGS